jgi:hypothetical protein
VAQTPQPSVTIGTHVLKLGMDETTVLEELGRDFDMQNHSGSWMAMPRFGHDNVPAGSVRFAAHKLTSAGRYWVVDENSSKSLVYAIHEATASLQRDGFTNCKISTSSESLVVDRGGPFHGNVTHNSTDMDCGVKGINIFLSLSDVVGDAPVSIEVSEWLRSK